MTNNEAIDKLIMLKFAQALQAKAISEDGKPLEPDFEIAVNKAIDAPEKQIPKKVELFEDENCCGEIRYRCPSCKHNFSMEEFELAMNYCDCGQALDWSEEE